MGEDSPRSMPSRFLRGCLLVLGGIVSLWLALELLSQFWGWILLVVGIALMLWCAVVAYRYWWGRRF
jgi:uncharacterized membrane protein YdbT with pleckstrin-like domain